MGKFRRNDFSRRLVLIFLYVSILVPVIPILLWSFSLRWTYPNLLPEWSTRAWEYVFNERTIVDTTMASIVLSTIVTIISLTLGFSTSKALGTREFKGKSAVEIFILLPAIVPVISVVMGMQGIFTRFYLSDTFTGVVLAQLVFTMPYMIMGLSSVFKNYNLEYEQQARTLGADQWNILIPRNPIRNLPRFSSFLPFAFVVSWSPYLLTIIIGGPAVDHPSYGALHTDGQRGLRRGLHSLNHFHHSRPHPASPDIKIPDDQTVFPLGE